MTREKIREVMEKRGMAHLLSENATNKKRTRATKVQMREREEAKRIEKNQNYTKELSQAHASSLELRESKVLLKAAAAGMVSKSNPEVVQAKNRLGKEGVNTLHKFDLLDHCTHDPLRNAEPLP